MTKVQNPELTKYVVELRRRGYPNSAICSILGVSIFTLWNHLEVAKLSRNNTRKLQPLTESKLVTMIKDIEITKALYVSVPSRIRNLRLTMDAAKRAATAKAVAKVSGATNGN